MTESETTEWIDPTKGDYTPPGSKTYDEMLEIAKVISPEARVKVTEDKKWEIYFPTEFVATWILPEKYRGTPAWDIAHDWYGGENQLERWGYKNGYGELCNEALADIINEEQRFQREAAIALSNLDKAAGIDTSDFDALTRKQFDQHEKHRHIVSKGYFYVQHIKNIVAINEKWGRS